ncbi:MAG TPA: methyltransferase domain-containing protein, partial [Rhodospirillales bacterium]|nr:methyltransferase domain-containing protein [Rhodospirillales bacterium]
MTSNKTMDDTFKSKQRREWDSVSAGWRKWWPVIEEGARPVSERLLSMAGLSEGQSVLDIATGIGEPAVSAARRVGPGGSVVATDMSPGMLTVARERAADLGLENITFEEVDGEEIDFAGRVFDAALCRWGLMFMPAPEDALARVRGHLRPGGAFAAAVWGAPPQVPFLSTPMAVIRDALKFTPPPGAPGLFSLSDPARLDRLFTSAGYADVRIENVQAVFSLPSVEDFIRYLQDVAGPIVTLLADQPPERRA